jgi:micrococcal nuclease
MNLRIMPLRLLPAFLLFLSLITPALSQPVETATVLKVVDGDTLNIQFQGRQESIRLIGIDCPESKKNAKAKEDVKRSGQDIQTMIALGKRATAFTKNLVKEGDTVKIEFDIQQIDKYRRLLGYVYLFDGRMLNEEIVKAGYAQPSTYPPNVKYQERFSKASQEARANGRGLWE